MRRLLCFFSILLGMLVPFSGIAKELIFAMDFTNDLTPAFYRKGPKGYFNGVLPRNMQENHTAWSPAKVNTRLMDDKDGRYLRFNVQERAPQYQIQIPDDSCLKRNQLLLVEMTMRNQMQGNIHINVRGIQRPWWECGEVFFPANGNRFQTMYRLMKLNSDAGSDNSSYMIYFRGTGICDLKSVKVYAVTEREAADYVEFKRIKPASATNFFHADRFVEGLPAGWCLQNTNIQSGTWRLTNDTTGPSGGRALELRSVWNNMEQGVDFFSEPFGIQDLNRKVCVSFSYKGDWDGAAEIQSNWDTIVKPVPMTPTKEWKRIKIVFAYPLFERGAVLRLTGYGKVLLDGFCVSHDLNGQYQPANTNTVSLDQREDSTLRDKRIHFAHEKDILRYHIYGDTRDAELRVSVTNLYKETQTLAPISLHGAKDGEFHYNVFPDSPLGQFRINAQLFRDGKAASPVAEYVICRIQQPPYWEKDAPNSPFAIHVDAVPESLRMAKAGGFNWTRLHDTCTALTGWYHLEQQPGVWTFHDEQIKLIRKHNVRIYGGLSTAPEWASYKGFRKMTGDMGYFNRYWVPYDWNAWSNYVGVVVGRYRGLIDEWFVWNEPFASNFFVYDIKNGTVRPPEPHKVYVKMLKLAYAAAKKANPNCDISGFCANVLGWADEVFEAGGYPYCDSLDYHLYNGGLLGDPKSDVGGELSVNTLFASVLKANNGKLGKRLIMSEGMGQDEHGFLYDQYFASGMYQAFLPWVVDEMPWTIRADRQVRYLLSHLYQGAARIFLYHGSYCGNFTRIARFNAITTSDGNPSPSLVAISALVNRVEDKKLVKAVDFGNNLYGYCFTNGTESVIAISGRDTHSGKLVYTGKGHIQIADLYGNPRNEINFQGQIMYVASTEPLEQLISNIKAR